jgi:hypothetical protein
MRLAALWTKEVDGKKVHSGELSSDSGICLPPGQKLMCKLVRNEKKQPGDKLPDYYIEAWPARPRTDEAPPADGQDEIKDDIPF